MRKLLTIIIISALVILDISLIRGSYDSSKKLAQISKQEEDVEQLKEKNKSLKEELEKRNSSFYIEQEARDRLNYGRPNETTIIVQEVELEDKEEEIVSNKSNWERWWELITN